MLAVPPLWVRLVIGWSGIILASHVVATQAASGPMSGVSGASAPIVSVAPEVRGTKLNPLVVETAESADDVQDKVLAKEQRRIEIENNSLTTRLTGALLVVALVQAAFFVWQLKLMRDSLDDTNMAAKAAMETANLAKEQLYLTQRAYIISPGIKLNVEWPGAHISNIDFFVTFENKGTTPATNVLVYVDHRLVPAADANDQSFTWEEPIQPAPGWLTPGVSMTTQAKRLSIADLMAVFNGEKAFILYAECRYMDVFGKAHRVETCSRLELFINLLELPKNGRETPAFWRWLVYHRHNLSE